jgi:hypothetical protein
VSSGCSLCHSLLAWDSREPFQFLLPPDTTDPNYRMHEYLRREFTGRPE